MNLQEQGLWDRRQILGAIAGTAWIALGSGGVPMALAAAAPQCRARGERLGQGKLGYRSDLGWGELDPALYPIKDCHGIAGDRSGRIVLLTNETRNNLIAYAKSGQLLRAWEHRFPGAHGLDIVSHGDQERYWITDHTRQLVSVCTAQGEETMRVGPQAVRASYKTLKDYRPTNTATMPDGDFYIADGYGASLIHHLDPQGRLIASFGGRGPGPENLYVPHSVWIDHRAGSPRLLVCDRNNNALKWFTPDGMLLKVLDLGPLMEDDEPIGVQPCNVAPFSGALSGHIAVACLAGAVLILDRADRIVSVIGGALPAYADGKISRIAIANHTFINPHDVYVDESHAIYVSQWGTNRLYPSKLELAGA